jgi:hypothetical protein
MSCCEVYAQTTKFQISPLMSKYEIRDLQLQGEPGMLDRFRLTGASQVSRLSGESMKSDPLACFVLFSGKSVVIWLILLFWDFFQNMRSRSDKKLPQHSANPEYTWDMFISSEYVVLAKFGCLLICVFYWLFLPFVHRPFTCEFHHSKVCKCVDGVAGNTHSESFVVVGAHVCCGAAVMFDFLNNLQPSSSQAGPRLFRLFLWSSSQVIFANKLR